MAKVRVKHGTEGPRHDPYGWTEIYFTRTDGTSVVYRYSGLGYNRITVNGLKIHDSHDDAEAREVFEALTGMDPDRAEAVPELLERRHLRSLDPKTRWMVEACMDADRRMMSYV